MRIRYCFTLLLVWLSSGVFALESTSMPSQAVFKSVQASVTDDKKLDVQIEIDLSLSDELKSALHKGLLLFFTLEMKVFEPHALWFDTVVLTQSRTWGIQHNLLLREWRVTENNITTKAFSLDEAIKHITQVKEWSIPLGKKMRLGGTYKGEIRLKLETSLLPRPFQITAFNNSSAWSFSSPWNIFNLHLSDKN